jgi:hypothetical protein
LAFFGDLRDSNIAKQFVAPTLPLKRLLSPEKLIFSQFIIKTKRLKNLIQKVARAFLRNVWLLRVRSARKRKCNARGLVCAAKVKACLFGIREQKQVY